MSSRGSRSQMGSMRSGRSQKSFRSGSPSMKSYRSAASSFRSSASSFRSCRSGGTQASYADVGGAGTYLKDDADWCETATQVVQSGDFQEMCSVTDPEELDAWVADQCDKMGQSKQEVFLKRFMKAHFFMNSGQADRGLSDLDIEVLLWLKWLYESDENDLEDEEDRQQKLPYDRDPVGFWESFLDVEETVKKIAPVWAKTDPPMIFGLKGYWDIMDMLDPMDPGTFLFRISNSEPWRLVAAYKVEEDVLQDKMDIKDDADKQLTNFIKRHRDDFVYLWDEKKQKSVPVDNFLSSCRTQAHLTAVNLNYQTYATFKSDAKSFASMRSGASGASYRSGASGASYRSGASGASYRSGASGASYRSGRSGASYRSGASGASYRSGASGRSGRSGRSQRSGASSRR